MSFLTRCTSALLATVFFSTAASAADWPNWRGSNHDGISREKGLKTTWGDSGPKTLWQRDIGSAYSSFACVGNKVFTCGTQDDKQVLFCLDAKTGKDIWKRPFAPAHHDSQGSGARATPTVDGNRVYIIGAKGRLACVDSESGNEVWSHQFNHPPKWGYSGSVLIQENLAITSPGQSDGAICALDKKTGKAIWTCGDAAAGYATPYPFTFNGKKYVCGFMATHAVVAELETGKLVLSMPWETDWNVNAATPIFHDGHLFLSSGYETGCGLFKLSTDSSSKLSAAEVWRSKVLMNKFQTPVLYQGKLYSNDQKCLSCVDFRTGKREWRKRRGKHGTIVLVDGNLILLTENGKLEIAKADPAGYSPTAEAKVLDGRCWTVPVMSGGKLYVRNMEKVLCLDLTTGS